MKGYLYIPSLWICVPVYSEGNRQKIVDAPNSAVLIKWRDLLVIADHAYQSNFMNLNRAVPGRTCAFFFHEGRMRKYTCDSIENGHIMSLPEGDRLYTENWKMVHEAIRDGLCIYTCRGKSAKEVMDVCLTHWATAT